MEEVALRKKFFLYLSIKGIRLTRFFYGALNLTETKIAGKLRTAKLVVKLPD